MCSRQLSARLVYIYIYIYRERERERETHTHIHTHLSDEKSLLWIQSPEESPRWCNRDNGFSEPVPSHPYNQNALVVRRSVTVCPSVVGLSHRLHGSDKTMLDGLEPTAYMKWSVRSNHAVVSLVQ